MTHAEPTQDQDQPTEVCPTCHHPASSHNGHPGAPTCSRSLEGPPSCWDCFEIQASLAITELTLYGQVAASRFTGLYHHTVDSPPIDPTPPTIWDALCAAFDAYTRARNAADDFEAAMEELVHSAGVEPHQVEYLKTAILQMAQTSGQSPADVALSSSILILPRREHRPHRAPAPAAPAAPRPFDTRVAVIRTATGYAWQCARQPVRECCERTHP